MYSKLIKKTPILALISVMILFSTSCGLGSAKYNVSEDYMLEVEISYSTGMPVSDTLATDDANTILNTLIGEDKQNVIAKYISVDTADTGEVNIKLEMPVKFKKVPYGGNTIIEDPDAPFLLGPDGASFEGSNGEVELLRDYLPVEVFMNKENKVTVVVFADEMFGNLVNLTDKHNNLELIIGFPGEIIDSSLANVEMNHAYWGNDMVLAATKKSDGALSATWSALAE